MNKIFKLFSVLTVLLLVMGLSSCIIIGGDVTDPTNMDIDTAAKFVTFLKNGSESGKLTDNIDLYEIGIIPAGKTKTLDLNGKTVTYKKNEEDTCVIFVSGTLTIIDSSTDNKTNQGALANDISDGVVILVDEDGSATINAGHYNAKPDGYGLMVSGTATVTNADFAGGSCISVANGGVINSLTCSASADKVAITIVAGGRIRTISSPNNEGYWGETTSDNPVWSLINHGVIEDLNGNFYSSAGGNGHAFGLINTGTINLIRDTALFSATVTGSGQAKNYNIGGTLPSEYEADCFEPELETVAASVYNALLED